MEEHSIRFGDLPLAGTFTRPAGVGPFPAAVLISGSGPLDRDSNHRGMRLDVMRQVAHALADAGVASLRYDKRGVGESPGDWLRAGLFDNATDAASAVATVATQPDISPDLVFVVGHGEGAVLATILAARGAPVAGLVLLSGTATRGEDVLLWQATALAPSLPVPVRAVLRLARTDLGAKVAKNHARLKATTTDVARIGAAKLNARWFREYMAYDPAVDLMRLRVPVLAVTGSKDLQVDPADLDGIRRLVPGPVETYLARDVTHTLRPQPGPASLSAYRAEVRDPVAGDVLARIVGWFEQYASR